MRETITMGYEDARRVIREHKARQAALTEEHGTPVRIAKADALGLALKAGGEHPERWPPADQVIAHIYRDPAAADAWLGSNLEHNGVPTLARFALPDGRVVGILDLRLALGTAKEGT